MADVQRLMGFYANGRSEIGNFVGGVQEIVMAVIASPEFLYRTIQPRSDQKRPQPLTALELASRLSFFLWSDVPDDELRQVPSAASSPSRPCVRETGQAHARRQACVGAGHELRHALAQCG